MITHVVFASAIRDSFDLCVTDAMCNVWLWPDSDDPNSPDKQYYSMPLRASM